MSYEENGNRGNLLSEFKLRLVSDPLEGAIQRNGRSLEPQLTLSVRDNQPRFTLYTNVENDKNKGIIEGNMDSYTFYAVMAALRDVIADPSIPGFQIENKGFFFNRDGERSKEPGVKSRTVIGRNDNGEIFITLVANNRPKAPFIFKPTEYHSMLNRDGTPATLAKVSELYAKGYVRLMELAISRILGDEYISYQQIKARKEAKRGGNGGGGGGYQRNNGKGGYGGYGNQNKGGNGGGGGYQRKEQSNESFGGDDDIPF